MAEKKTDKLTEAAEKTAAVLQGLQSRLSGEAGGVRNARPEIPDDLGKQLEEYFAAASPSSMRPDEIRTRVMEGVVNRILGTWQEPDGRLSEVFKNDLVERLIERVVEAIQKEKTDG